MAQTEKLEDGFNIFGRHVANELRPILGYLTPHCIAMSLAGRKTFGRNDRLLRFIFEM